MEGGREGGREREEVKRVRKEDGGREEREEEGELELLEHPLQFTAQQYNWDGGQNTAVTTAGLSSSIPHTLYRTWTCTA